MSRGKQNKHPDVLSFIHITDTHLLDQAEETFHNLNTKQCFESVLSDSQKRYPDVDFLLITGDISQTGSRKSYAIFKSITQQFELPTYCVPGNHDIAKLLQESFSNSPNDSLNIIQFGKFSLILINSCVENQHHGNISQHCLQQLEEQLQNNQGQFNIIATHHPPVLINSKWLDGLGLRNKAEFLHVINEYSQNTLLLFGHIHQEIDQQLTTVRLLSTPSTCHQFEANTETMHRVYTPPPAYRYVRLTTAPNSTKNIETKVHYVKVQD
jgi:Icc protein